MVCFDIIIQLGGLSPWNIIGQEHNDLHTRISITTFLIMQVCEKNNGVMINATIKIIKSLAYTSLESVCNVGALWKIRQKYL